MLSTGTDTPEGKREGNKDALPPFPPEDSKETAFDYFNNPYFFDEISNKNALMYFVENRRDSKDLQVTLNVFFQEARKREKEDRGDLVVFFTFHISLCKHTAVLRAYNQWKKDNNIDSADDMAAKLPRLVNVDYRIKSSNLSHTYDLDCFAKRVDHVFECHANSQERLKYVAPYFCFVQSSGMGKTKLLYEYKRVSFEKHQVVSFLILPSDVTTNEPEDSKGIFERVNLGRPLSTPQTIDQKVGFDIDRARPVAATIFATLDKMLEELVTKAKKKKDPMKDVRKIALLFDESEGLLEREFGYDAFRFRCVRLWLREEPSIGNFRGDEKLTVVAVFTGTSSRLTNFLVESDDELATFFQPSREFRDDIRIYNPQGNKLYDPFCQTTTMGSCLHLLKKRSGLSEYERAVYHGRPLFALMAKSRILENKLPSILLRMLRRVKWTEDNQNGWINVLSTRVQLGQLPADVASDLVANGYAHLCAYNSNSSSVRLAYLPDPVAASLAMCMMDENFEVNVTSRTESATINGKSKKDWAEILTVIFATGLVSPDKGDFGVVVVALYMLFCGDELRTRTKNAGTKRSRIVQPYRQFSTSLDAWLHLMLSGGKLSSAPMDECKVSVGFIQVCRNHLRSYATSWKSLKDQGFLSQMYESGTAFYTFDGCPLVDMVVPLRIRSDEEGNVDGFCYAPMFVSIKCRRNFGHGDAQTACANMTKRAINSGLDRALCLLIVFGSEMEADPFKGDIAINEDLTAISDQVTNGVVAKAIRLPNNDEFGLGVAFDAMVSSAQIEAELLASHPYLKAHGPDTADNKEDYTDLQAEKAMRTKSSNYWKDIYGALRNAMAGTYLPDDSSLGESKPPPKKGKKGTPN